MNESDSLRSSDVPGPSESRVTDHRPFVPALLDLAHAVLWRDLPHLIHVGLDRDGCARKVRVSVIDPRTRYSELVDVAGALTGALADRSLADLERCYPSTWSAMGYLVRQARAIEVQAGPIVRFAHRVAIERERREVWR